ncbi:hypothetical protein AMJ49_01950 [Parcubacteria bacterium DG_74_2]|nr:MAG: hypothetical protein AMJ49_01950 [Parcubacteria bacterium DG_74_2]
MLKKFKKMKITIPHIHKIEGEAGFWAKVTKEGKIEELKLKTLEGLRQIEGILIGRRFFEVPMVVSRVCGICPVVHILNACSALEKALNVKVSKQTILLRRLMLANQIIQSHTLHLFFMSLADFFNIENDLDLIKKFPKESKAALQIRDFSLKILKTVGGRAIHPITPIVGGFSKLPDKKEISEILKDYDKTLESSFILANLFKNLDYPAFKRKIIFTSLASKNEYPFYETNLILVNGKKISIGDFYSTKIEEDLRTPPIKKVKYKGKPYILGAIARMSNNFKFLNPQAKKVFKGFTENKKEIFKNIFYNLFFQVIEVLHFLEESQKIIKEILEIGLKKETSPEVRIQPASGLSAMEAPRGTLFTYFELDKKGRVFNCNIVTPSAQFLNNLEEDLRVFLPQILKLSQKEKIRKIRSLIRIYDPCISCATH